MEIDRTYTITDHLSANVDEHGSIHLILTSFKFNVDSKEKAETLPHISDLPNLNSNTWTKEWKSSDLPIFCKAEHLIQKKSGIAFRFRLGSLDYVNALEGK